MREDYQHIDCAIIGAGLTGLTLAHCLGRAGYSVLVLERSERVGGQIQTIEEGGFVYETGPNTGIVSCPEVAELFTELGDSVTMQTAGESSRKRLIYKDGAFHPLPSSLSSAISTTLFSWKDKLRILGEPFRPKGTHPDESVADLVRRRLGESYYRYAVDPFVGGIYAGDPEQLVTRYALPRLYALEQDYGSFVRGALAKMRVPKGERERLVTKAIFSAEGGLSRLTEALAESIGRERILLGQSALELSPLEEGGFRLKTNEGLLTSSYLVPTVGTSSLASLLSFADAGSLEAIRSLRYAPVVQIAVGYRAIEGVDFDAFGGLMPSCEDSELLGILNLSAGFSGRAPEGGLLLSAFFGGMRSPRLIERSDEELRELVVERLRRTLGIEQMPDLLKIHHHKEAIPQYEASTGARLEAIGRLERHYPGLLIGGNLIGGIGMPDRIAQGYALAKRIKEAQTRCS